MQMLTELCFIQLGALQSISYQATSTLEIKINKNIMRCSQITKFKVEVLYQGGVYMNDFVRINIEDTFQLKLPFYNQENTQIQITFITSMFREVQIINEIQSISFLIKDCITIDTYLLYPIGGIQSFQMHLNTKSCPSFIGRNKDITTKMDWYFNDSRISLLNQGFQQADINDEICVKPTYPPLINKNIQMYKCCSSIECNFQVQKLIKTTNSSINMVFIDQAENKYYSHTFENIFTSGPNISKIIKNLEQYEQEDGTLFKITKFDSYPEELDNLFINLIIIKNNEILQNSQFVVSHIPQYLKLNLKADAINGSTAIFQFSNQDGSPNERQAFKINVVKSFIENIKLYKSQKTLTLKFDTTINVEQIKLDINNYDGCYLSTNYTIYYLLQKTNTIVIDDTSFIDSIEDTSQIILIINNFPAEIKLFAQQSLLNKKINLQYHLANLGGFLVTLILLFLVPSGQKAEGLL